jgi:prepilin-type N-terminal cleavage/methylation domain-containing protein
MLKSEARVRSTSGYTLLEVMLSLAVLSTFLASMGTVMISSFRAYTEMSVSMNAEETANRVVDRIVWDLRFVPRTEITLAQPTNARALSFRRVQGWQGDAPVLSAPETFAFAGGRITWNGIVIADNIKDLIFNLNGHTLTVVLEIERTAMVGGFSRTFVESREVKITV